MSSRDEEIKTKMFTTLYKALIYIFLNTLEKRIAVFPSFSTNTKKFGYKENKITIQKYCRFCKTDHRRKTYFQKFFSSLGSGGGYGL